MSLAFEPAKATNARADKTVHLHDDGDWSAQGERPDHFDIWMAQGRKRYKAEIAVSGDTVIARFPIQPQRPTMFEL